MKRTWKQIGSLLMAVFMVFTMLSTVAFGAEGEILFTYNNHEYKVLTEDTGAKTGTVALVGGTTWSNLSVAETVYHDDITYTVTQVGDGSGRIFPLALNMGNITISNTVTTIADYAFRGAAMDSITLGNSLKTIGKGAFQNSLVLKNVQIPDSVTTIEEGAFSYPRDLQQVTFGASSQLENIGNEAFKSCDKLTEISIPDSVTTLGNGAFSFCGGLTTLAIGNGIEAIGESAFTWCIKLEDLTISSSVKSIGANAFASCRSLKAVNIPNSVTKIGSAAFSDCTELLAINIPNSVIEIGNEAFGKSIKLNDVIIPKSVETIGTKLFQECTGLKTVTVGNMIEEYMFYGCTSLESVTITGTPDKIGRYAFSGCTAISSIIIPDSVKAIDTSAFYNCSNLSNISWGNLVETIGSGSFSNTSFTAVTIPNTVTMIDRLAFRNCNELTDVTIGSGVKTMNNQIFYNCAKLKSVTFLGDVPATIYSDAFQGCTSLTSIHVPDDKVDAYKAKLTSNTDIIKLMILADTEITGFNALADVGAGTAGNAIYANATAVITALPANVTANYSGGTVEWPVTTWVDTDGYNSAIAGNYTFTATLDAAPAGYANSGGHTSTVEVVVSAALPHAPITTAAELKSALTAITPANINVAADIDLRDHITLGASHTLNIDSGKTVSTQWAGPTEGTIEIPAGMTLTLAGSGTFKSDNYLISGIVVLGTLRLEPDSKLLAASSGLSTNGFELGRDSTPGTLVSNGGHITLQNSGMLSAGIKGCSTVPSDVTLNGGTLTISNTGDFSFGISDVRLTVNDCEITVSSSGNSYATGIDAIITTLQNGSTLTIENSVGKGLYGSLSVDASTVTVKNSGDSGIVMDSGHSLDLTNNSILDLENTGGTGLILTFGSEMTVDDSAVNVKDGGGMGFAGNMPFTTVSGLSGGRFILTENAKLSGVEGLLRDQNFVCRNNNSITVGAPGASPSADGLTSGEYVWKGGAFAKGDATTTYPISVTNGTASPTAAKPGTIVTLTAYLAPAGQQFKEWICTSNNATIVYDEMTMYWKFTMPGEAVTVKAIYETAPYLYVLDVPVNDANKDSITGQGISGGVSYDPTTKTLTLNNAVITSSTYNSYGIDAADDITVRLEGQNRIGTAPNNPSNTADYGVLTGIFSRRSLSITGEGSLTVYDAITGICGVDNLTIDIGGSLIVVEYGDDGLSCCLKTDGALTINRGNLNLTSYNSKGLKGGSILINGGVITAQTQGTPGNFAFSTEPSFGGAYAHRVFAGDNADMAVEVPSPVAVTFTASKYVRIQPEGAKSYTISFNTNGGNALNPGTLTTGTDGKLSVLPVPTRSGNYRFEGWYTAADGGAVVTTGTVFTADTTIYAHWTYTGGDAGGGSSSGGSTTIPPVTPPATPAPSVSGSTATTTVTSTTDTDGKAAASVPAAQVDSALKQAQDAAAKSGDAPKIEIKVEAPDYAASVNATVLQASMAAMASGNLQDMTISSPVAYLTFDGAALSTIAGAAAGDVKFSAAKVDIADLPSTVQTLLGNRPVYEFNVTSGDKTISQFNGNVTVAVPYQLGAGENPNAVIISLINASGNLEIVTNGRYDAAAGTVVFTTDHFSKYAIGYNKIYFTDVTDSAWYADAVTFLAARGITGGTTTTTFSPDATLTRGQFITLLMRAYDLTADENTTGNFSDAGSTYYTGYLAAAKRLGITSGVGENRFAPEQAITRQEMFTMLYNALKALNRLPIDNSGKTLADFSDSGDVETWAIEALTALAKSGTVSGSGGKLDPAVGSTRAQMAQLLYNLLGK